MSIEFYIIAVSRQAGVKLLRQVYKSKKTINIGRNNMLIRWCNKNNLCCIVAYVDKALNTFIHLNANKIAYVNRDFL